MFRRIIVAYDGSDRAQDALALALRLRDPDDGELTLACAISERPWLPGRPRSVSEAVSDETELMLAAGRRKSRPAIRVSLRAPVASSPARALTELAEDEQADLIVVGSSRRSRGRARLARAHRRAPAPGRAVRGRRRARRPARDRRASITSASPTTGRPRPRARSRRATRIAARTGAAITLFYALTDVSQADEREPCARRLRAQELLDEAAVAAPAGVNPRTLLLHGVPGKADRRGVRWHRRPAGHRLARATARCSAR